MRKIRLLIPVLAAALAAVPALAAPAKKRPAKPRPAAVAEAPPVYASKTGVHVGQAALMRPLTEGEAEANAIWNLRAGLNVAALQCQYSRFLGTVKTYNDMLKHHSAELAAAQTTLLAHFKRYDGTRALNSFDQFTTKTYNSFSTLDAQYSFCAAAADVGRGALMLTKGGLGKYALAQIPVLRSSLTPAGAAAMFAIDAQPLPLPPVEG